MSEPIDGTFVVPGDLSDRERAVTRLVAAGLTNREIGERLGIMEPTVKDHLWVVRQKLGARNRTHLAAIAARHGLHVARPRGEPEPPVPGRG